MDYFASLSEGCKFEIISRNSSSRCSKINSFIQRVQICC
ncbi:hypothetical protein MTR67_044901 [Solanum verrucosum]|uniref:Uncharacterized protein n=1 Tax=Solanum verrucosum TaxID=315347 RepID=A0AAF0UUA7_SOLVR|nr:hypothetical protein MTR67_044901 [Solanum verrucosum]